MDSSSAAASSTIDGVLLAGKDDRYGGFIIDPLSLPAHPQDFIHALRNSLTHWKSQGKKGIWLKLPVKNANLVPLAVEEGFCYHHAEKDYVMLTFWIPEVPSTIPANASHQVGVDAIIVNDKNEVLVVQEITGPTGIWKVPTGVVHQGENILDAVSREVKEKTGVETKFIEVLGIRQSHDAAFGKSELVFLCKLQPLSLEINIQETEILAAKWIPLYNDFRSLPSEESVRPLSYNDNRLSRRIKDMTTASVEGTYQGFGAEMLTFGFRNKEFYFYHNLCDISKFIRLFEHF